MLRRLLIAAVLVAGFAAVASPRGLAATITCPDPQPNVIQSQHFYLTYQDAPGNQDSVTQSQAQSILGGAEQAYSTFVGMGFAAPWGGAQIEIDIVNLSASGFSAEYCVGAFDFDTATVGKANQDDTLYASVFTQFEYGQGVSDDWLVQGLSEWAAYKALAYPDESIGDLGPWDISLDCTPTINGTSGEENDTCSKVPYENVGASRWPFYEYLAEKYGSPSFVNELMGDAAATDGLTGLQNALSAHGTTLATEYGSFAAKLLSGGWTATGLNTVSPPVSATILTGAATGDTAPQKIRVGHLASRFVQIDRGDGSAAHKCYAATLTLTVAIPAGVTSQPVFYWAAANSTPVPLAVSGSTATASLPWDTCTWAAHGYVSLPNESTTIDDAYFEVSTHLAVTTTEVTATPPSTPANGYGNSTDAGSAFGAPTIALRGPSTLKLSANDTTLDLVVESSDQGTISAKLGALNLGTKTVVPGMNAIHFSLPAGSTGTLTVTPASSDGKTVGKAVTMTVSKDAPTTVKRKLKLKRNAKLKRKLKFAPNGKKPKK